MFVPFRFSPSTLIIEHKYRTSITVLSASDTNRSHFHFPAQSEEFPADRDQPDHFEDKEDYVADAYNGPESLTEDGYGSSYYAQVRDTSIEDTSQHHKRNDQNADREQDTAGGH